MEKWEYMTRFISANIENSGAREHLARAYPNRKDPPKFAPETMEPYINQLGDKGWELVHMQPVWIGKNYDVHNYGYSKEYTNVYFCAFKRRKQS